MTRRRFTGFPSQTAFSDPHQPRIIPTITLLIRHLQQIPYACVRDLVKYVFYEMKNAVEHTPINLAYDDVDAAVRTPLRPSFMPLLLLLLLLCQNRKFPVTCAWYYCCRSKKYPVDAFTAFVIPPPL